MVYISQFLQKVWSAMGYYRRNGYYHFIGTNVLKIILLYGLIVVGIVMLAKYVLDIRLIYQGIIHGFSDAEVLILFFVSESFLGMIPPDLFMLWAEKFAEPLPMLTLLGVLSYIGGLISYRIGAWIAGRERIKTFTENRLKRYIELTQRWGGAFIAIAALFPFSPYSMVVMAVSLLKYPFHKLLYFGVFRIIRFVVQGTVLIKLLQLDFG